MEGNATSRPFTGNEGWPVAKIERMNSQDASATFSTISGTMLEAVTFVMDYVQLHFGSARLTAYTLPQVELAGRCWKGGDDGWRDSLCARIGVVVRSASCTDQRLQVEFEDGATVTVSLSDKDYRGPEAFELSIPGHTVIVA
jgi:hypothetical protein